MRVAVIALGAVSVDTGGRTYLGEILGPLGDESEIDIDVHLADRESEPPSNCRVVWHTVPTSLGAAGRILAEARLAASLSKDGYDVLFAPFNFVPVTWRGPSVVVQHNVLSFGERLRSEISLMRAWYRPRALRSTLRRATEIIAVSSYLRELLLNNFPATDPRHVHVVPCGVSPALVAAAATQEEDLNGRRLLVVSSLWPYKRVDQAIKAFAVIARDFPDLSLQIAGSDYRSERRNLSSLARKLAVADRVEFLGNVPPDRLGRLYGSSQAVIYASEIEALGLPVLESMACGVPVVARRVGGLAEIGGDAPFWVNADARPREFADALTLVLTNEVLRIKHVEEGIRQARQFRWERTANLTADLLRSACGASESHLLAK